jgi:hypothetical protein
LAFLKYVCSPFEGWQILKSKFWWLLTVGIFWSRRQNRLFARPSKLRCDLVKFGDKRAIRPSNLTWLKYKSGSGCPRWRQGDTRKKYFFKKRKAHDEDRVIHGKKSSKRKVHDDDRVIQKIFLSKKEGPRWGQGDSRKNISFKKGRPDDDRVIQKHLFNKEGLRWR